MKTRLVILFAVWLVAAGLLVWNAQPKHPVRIVQVRATTVVVPVVVPVFVED